MERPSPNSRIITTNQGTSLTALYSILPPTPWVSLVEGLLFGLPAGALMAVLVALRLKGSLIDVGLVFLGALGLHGLLVGLAAGVLRICRPLPSRSPIFALGVGVAILPLARIGAILAERTHHRPLGAVTFVLSALVIVLGYWVVAARAVSSRRSSHRVNRLFGLILLGGLVLVSLLVGVSPILAWIGSLAGSSLQMSALIDGLLGACLIAIGGFVRFPIRIELLARTAGPMALGVCILSFLVAVGGDVTPFALARVSALYALLH